MNKKLGLESLYLRELEKLNRRHVDILMELYNGTKISLGTCERCTNTVSQTRLGGNCVPHATA